MEILSVAKLNEYWVLKAQAYFTIYMKKFVKLLSDFMTEKLFFKIHRNIVGGRAAFVNEVYQILVGCWGLGKYDTLKLTEKVVTGMRWHSIAEIYASMSERASKVDWNDGHDWPTTPKPELKIFH